MGTRGMGVSPWPAGRCPHPYHPCCLGERTVTRGNNPPRIAAHRCCKEQTAWHTVGASWRQPDLTLPLLESAPCAGPWAKRALCRSWLSPRSDPARESPPHLVRRLKRQGLPEPRWSAPALFIDDFHSIQKAVGFPGRAAPTWLAPARTGPDTPQPPSPLPRLQR